MIPPSLPGSKAFGTSRAPRVAPSPTVARSSTRVTGEGYEIHPLHAYDDRIAPDDELRWTRVPEGKILRKTSNPTGHAIACYSVVRRKTAPIALGIYCFVPEAGT